MKSEKRLIDANAFRNLLQQVVYDVFTVHEHNGELTGTASVGYYTETIEQVLKQTPTVDAVEVVHGRWKVSRESEISRNVWCTACGKDFYMHRKGELQIDKMPYCPNCGAKMDGDGNA